MDLGTLYLHLLTVYPSGSSDRGAQRCYKKRFHCTLSCLSTFEMLNYFWTQTFYTHKLVTDEPEVCFCTPPPPINGPTFAPKTSAIYNHFLFNTFLTLEYHYRTFEVECIFSSTNCASNNSVSATDCEFSRPDTMEDHL